MNFYDAVYSHVGGNDLTAGLIGFFQAYGATSEGLNEAEMEFLVAMGYTTGSVQDRWMKFLAAQGYTGDLTKRVISFFNDRALLSPAHYFSGGAQGGHWEIPDDLSGLWQDAGGTTTPVTAAGQSVGRWNDSSGNGNDFRQATGAAKPILRQDANSKYYLEFNGSSRFMPMASAAINLSASDKMVTMVGVLRSNDAAIGTIYETTGNFSSNNGAITALSPSTAAGTDHYVGFKGTTASTCTYSVGAAPQTHIVTGIADIAGDSVQLRVNGVLRDSSAGDLGTGNFNAAGNLYIGARAGTSRFLNGGIYGLTIVGGTLTANQIKWMEYYLANKMGVTI